jgi:hypothetical protein
MTEKTSIEIFQDLALRGPADERKELRQILIAKASKPWSHAERREKEMAGRLPDRDVIAFERISDDQLPAASLALWWRVDAYEIGNIVPREFSELGIPKYNALLQEFARLIAEPAAEVAGFLVEITPAHQSLEDLSSPEVATALHQFSSAANKSTGASHPSDSERWLRFLIAAHRTRCHLRADQLARWLKEVEGWDDDHAHELAIQYEFARELLEKYDLERR